MTARKIGRGFAFAAALLLAASAFAKNPWATDYHKWSAHDCEKVLKDSPWARQLRFGDLPITMGSQELARENSPQVTYIVQDRSAQPVREALVREAQINSKYDQMAPEKRAAFDQNAAKFLGETFPDRIVIHVEYSSNAQFFNDALTRYWQTAQPETLKKSMFLVVPGQEDVAPSQVVLGQGGQHSFDMIFPRQGKNSPLLRPDTKYLRVRFDAPLPSVVPPSETAGSDAAAAPSSPGVFVSRIVIDFSPGKMMLDGKLEY